MPRMMEDPQERQENRPFDNLNELEIIKSDKELPEKKTLNQARKEGLDVQVKFSRDSFVYELKIPLLALESQPLAIGVPPKAAIGVGFETGELDSSRMMRPPGGIGGGGMPPMGGRMGGMGGGRGFGMRSQMLKPMKIWVKVQLVQSGGISQPVFLFINDKSCAETDK